ncbi:MAG: tetratricopeptide repeat protein [Planctomycetota bacterium]
MPEPKRETPQTAARRVTLCGIALLAMVCAVYANAWTGPFIADDFPAIVDNPQVRSLPACWRAAFDDRQSSVSGRPIPACTLALNYAVGGLDVRGYHAFNVSVHALCSLVLFGIVRRMLQRLGERRGSGGTVRPAFAASMLWAVHPLHTETVNYVVQRTELLVGLFCLLTVYAALRGAASPRSRWWSLLAVACCAGGMLCKEVMAAAPLLVLLVDRTMSGGGFAGVIRRRRWLYAGLAATWLILASLILAGPRNESVGFRHGTGAWQYLSTQAGVLTHYLRLSFWPSPLVVSYHDWPLAGGFASVLPQALLIGGLLAATGVAVARGSSGGLVGAWCFLILAPSSSVVPIVTEVAAERRMYLPLAGLTVGAVLGCVRLLPLGSGSRRRWGPIGVPQAALAVVGIALAGATLSRNRDYRLDVTIWEDAVAKRPANAAAHCALGFHLERAGRLDDAVPFLREAVRLEHDYADGFFHLARVLYRMGRYDESVEASRRALSIHPDHTEAAFNLGLTLQASRRFEEAAAAFRTVLDRQPNDTPARLGVGTALEALGRKDEAMAEFRRVIESDPLSSDARFNLAVLLAEQGDHRAAVEQFRAVIVLSPRDVTARLRLADSLVSVGAATEAVAEYRQVLALDPGNEEARQGLAALSPSGGGPWQP